MYNSVNFLHEEKESDLVYNCDLFKTKIFYSKKFQKYIVSDNIVVFLEGNLNKKKLSTKFGDSYFVIEKGFVTDLGSYGLNLLLGKPGKEKCLVHDWLYSHPFIMNNGEEKTISSGFANYVLTGINVKFSFNNYNNGHGIYDFNTNTIKNYKKFNLGDNEESDDDVLFLIAFGTIGVLASYISKMLK